MKRNITKLTSKALVFGIALVQALLFGVVFVPPAYAQSCSTTTSPATSYGQVKQSVSVSSAGSYRVWSRIKAPDTTNNSFYLQIDGGCAINVGDGSGIPANSWKWVNYQDGNTGSLITVSLSAGSHQLTYTGKEANVELDRILLLGDTSCVPTGTGDNCVNVDSSNPTVSLTSPSNGDTVKIGDSVTIAANATDDSGVTKVEFYNGSTRLGTDTSAPYSYAWDTTGQAAGSKSITAKAYDAAGNVGTSAAVSITLSTTGSTNIPGDANGDNHVNGIDYSILSEHDNEDYPPADFNHDGNVGAPDLSILLAKWTW